MMISRREFALTVPLAAVSVRSLKAAGVDGKWKAEVENPRGVAVIMFDLKSEGEALTGTAGNDNGMTEITDGKVSGDGVSFVQVVTRGNFEMRVKYEGKVMGDELELTRTMERPAGGRPGGGQGGGRPGGGQGAGGGGGGGRPVTFTAMRVK